MKRYSNYKDSGVKWIGEIPSHWKTARIRYLLEERNERSKTGKEEPLSMSQKYGIIPTSEMNVVPNMAASFEGAKLAYIGDMVFNKLKAHLGVFAVSKYDGLVSPDYAVYYNTEYSNIKYLELLFRTPLFISEIKKSITGVAAGLTRLYSNDLFSVNCYLPPLEEQQRIVDYLICKTDKIEQYVAERERERAA